MRTVCSFCNEIGNGQETLLTQGLRGSTCPLETQEGQVVYSKCIITLALPVKPDFYENALKFDDSDSTTLYMLHFEAIEQNCSVAKKRLTVHNIQMEVNLSENDTSVLKDTQKTVTDNFRAGLSAITSEDYRKFQNYYKI